MKNYEDEKQLWETFSFNLEDSEAFLDSQNDMNQILNVHQNFRLWLVAEANQISKLPGNLNLLFIIFVNSV